MRSSWHHDNKRKERRYTRGSRRISDESFTDLVMWTNNGEKQSSTYECIESIDPATGEPWCRMSEASGENVDGAVASAQRAYEKVWSIVRPIERTRVLNEVASVVCGCSAALTRSEARGILASFPLNRK